MAKVLRKLTCQRCGKTFLTFDLKDPLIHTCSPQLKSLRLKARKYAKNIMRLKDVSK